MKAAFDKITGKYIDSEDSSVIKDNWKYLNDPAVIIKDISLENEPWKKKLDNGAVVSDPEKDFIPEPEPTLKSKIEKLQNIDDVKEFLLFLYGDC